MDDKFMFIKKYFNEKYKMRIHLVGEEYKQLSIKEVDLLSRTSYASLIEELEQPILDLYDVNNINNGQALLLTLYGEASSLLDENPFEIELITHVILNRVNSSRYPDSIEEVVKQRAQFSCWGDHNLDRMKRPSQKVMKAMREIVYSALVKRSRGLNPLPGVLNYIRDYKIKRVKLDIVEETDGVRWPRKMRVAYYGKHYFLKRDDAA